MESRKGRSAIKQMRWMKPLTSWQSIACLENTTMYFSSNWTSFSFAAKFTAHKSMSMSLRPTFFNLCLKSQVDSDSQEWAFWHTSASLQFLLRVKVLSERLVTFKGTQRWHNNMAYYDISWHRFGGSSLHNYCTPQGHGSITRQPSLNNVFLFCHQGN